MPDFKNPLDITWAQFEMCNPDTRTAFESMCRFLFNTTFFNGKGLFHSNPNNPGVEILPILYEESGQRISFQAKYFSVLDYSQIKHSAEMAIKHYAGKLDVIYLYCNKDVTTSSDSYQNIEKLEDFICAKQILKRYQDQRNELISYIQSDLLDIKNGQIGNYSNVDIVIVLCSLYAERFHKECFTAISGPVTDENDLYDISRRYIESFLWRKAAAINAAEFIEYINEHNVPKSSVLRVFIENSTKENHPLNAMLLHDILMNKSLAHRDYLWTTFINGLAHEEERLYQLMESLRLNLSREKLKKLFMRTRFLL